MAIALELAHCSQERKAFMRSLAYIARFDFLQNYNPGHDSVSVTLNDVSLPIKLPMINMIIHF